MVNQKNAELIKIRVIKNLINKYNLNCATYLKFLFDKI